MVGVLTILYILLSLGGLYLFRGIPLLNVALGFPLGAAIAHRLLGRATASDGRLVVVLQSVIWWALASAGITLLLCWLELAASLLALHLWRTGVTAVRWVPLLPPPGDPIIARVQYLAVVTAPALQVLTTAFGGLIVIAFGEHRARTSR